MGTVFALVLAVGSWAAGPEGAHDGQGWDPAVVARGVEDPAVVAWLVEVWEARMAAGPVQATALGDPRYDALWPDLRGTVQRRAAVARERQIEAGRALLGGSLGASDRRTVTLQLAGLEASRDTAVCHTERWAISPRNNPWMDLSELAQAHGVVDESSATAYVARLRAFPRYVAQDLRNRRLGARTGWVGTAESIRRTVAQLDEVLGDDVSNWEAALDGEERAALTGNLGARVGSDIEATLAGPVRNALIGWRDAVRDEILPLGRVGSSEGVGALPDGAACYAAAIRAHTTLDLGVDEVHELGLREMAKIQSEMRTVAGRLFGTEDLGPVFERLRHDPALHFGSAEEVEAEAQRSLARAEAAMPAVFSIWPKAPCQVRRIPEHEAPFTTIAYYQPPNQDRGEPGFYFINTYDPTSRPRTEAAALAYHEAVPGHHTQIAIGQELGELPMFRRHDYVTAFSEGWALYGERLADELQLYPGDVERMGMLSFDAWRAARLVVDTGLHGQGWTREQAVAWMLENTPLAENNIDNEVDRYLAWPGQALGYKVGQLEILRLRAEAEARLGDRFDLRGFHDAVLRGGAVTLPVLRQQVDDWITSGAAP